MLNNTITAEHAKNAEEINKLTEVIIGAAIEVHPNLGPGLLESAYEACLEFELKERGLRIERQVELPLCYKMMRLDCGYRLDLLVDGVVIVEVKSVCGIVPIHQAQLTSYLKLSGCRLGLLINFNVMLLKDGIKRIVNNL